MADESTEASERFDVVRCVAALSAVDVEALEASEVGAFVRACEQVARWAQARSVQGLAVAERLRVPLTDGVRSPATWLRRHGPISRAEARRRARAAQLVETVPAFGDALAAGQVSVEHLTRVADVARSLPVFAHAARRDATRLIDAARTLDLDTFEQTLRTWQLEVARESNVDLDAICHARRRCTVYADDLGMVGLAASLPAEGGAVVREALRQIADELWRREHPERNPSRLDDVDSRARWADALVEMARRAMAGGVRSTVVPKPLLVVHVNIGGWDLDAATKAEIEGVGPISPAVLAKLACEADVVGVLFDGPGKVLRLGRTRRLASDDQWTALRARDRGCVFPGCGRPPAACIPHHLREWVKHRGDTDIDWLALVCHEHHAAIHRGAYTIAGPAPELRISRGAHPDGPVVLDRRPPAAPERAA